MGADPLALAVESFRSAYGEHEDAPAETGRPLRLLLYRPTRTFRGLESYLVGLAHKLASRGHHLLVVTTEKSSLLQPLSEVGVPTASLPIGGDLDMGAARLLGRLLRELRMDVLNTHGAHGTYLAARVARRMRVPSVSTIHKYAGLIPDPAGGRWDRGRLRTWLRRWGWMAYWASDHLVAISEACRRDLLRCGFHEHRISVVYNGVEPAEFGRESRGAARAALGLPAEPFFFGTLSAMIPSKGHRYFLEAFSAVAGRCPQARAVLAGDGPLRSSLEAQAAVAGAGDRVTFLGHRTDTARVLAALDCVVVPSLGENLSMVMLEGMASERAVVVTDVGAATEAAVNGENAWVVPPGDPDAIAAAMERVLLHPEESRCLAQAARRTIVERFTLDHTAQGMEDVFRRMLGGRQKARK